ncbi:chaperone modulator CbpM [Nitrosococcus oceani]|uniref:Transcriptional regulator, MerR family n=2 Tax=Nitrosococcus oceani TaxID=1229 RepID=Q3JBB9_NITOC|nr:chaperone modulator CbpM [Nitrosococcus oceani]ABA57877.1 transcriptional regulator, MerR family [Nitrosococcus oceani ATCC 19707]KFI19603.1 MerR family transcriptional regulator [Nitrosococcus oceani C-27]KFI22869.1 MerR family transcriptional regulator [Nitrosococcus oceani]GEM19517.1 MerR family transcriptional regulator [Nitrosococcus oceani]
MSHELMNSLTGEILEEDVELTLAELCRTCQVTAERVFQLVEYGVVEPQGYRPEQWRFRGVSVRRIRCAQRLEQDLEVNLAGTALALELLDELTQLRARLQRLED